MTTVVEINGKWFVVQDLAGPFKNAHAYLPIEIKTIRAI